MSLFVFSWGFSFWEELPVQKHKQLKSLPCPLLGLKQPYKQKLRCRSIHVLKWYVPNG